MENEIVLFETEDHEVKLHVPVENNTVWLNRKQLAELFGRDVKTIGKHINNALKEELDNSVVANFATTASDGKVYQVEHYNLDMIISVGYRVKSRRGVEFRRWANDILKQYILNGCHLPRNRGGCFTDGDRSYERHIPSHRRREYPQCTCRSQRSSGSQIIYRY